MAAVLVLCVFLYERNWEWCAHGGGGGPNVTHSCIVKFLLHRLLYKRLSSSPSLSESRMNSLSQEAQAIKNESGNKALTQEKIVLALSLLIERVPLTHKSGKEVVYQI